MAETEHKPLLDMERGPDEEWERVDDLPADVPTITVQELIRQDPDHVLQNIKAGVVKLGEFKVEDTTLLRALGDASMLTMGAGSAHIDFEAAWRGRLARMTGAPAGGGGAARGKGRGRRRGSGWSRTVTAEAFVVRIRNAAHPDADGLIRPLVMRWQAGGCHYSVFGLPAVQAVLEFKWDTFCRVALLAELLFCRVALLAELFFFLTWLVSFSAFTLLFQDEDPRMPLSQLLQTTTGRATVGCGVLSLVGMAPFLVVEWSTLTTYSLGWLNLWNTLDLCTYGLQIAIVALHFTRVGIDTNWFVDMVAVQCVLLFFRLNYFSRLFANKFSFLDSLQQVVMDCRFYLFFLLLMTYGFACSYCVLFRNDQDLPQFSDISHSLLTVLNYAMGGVDLKAMLDSSNPRAAMVLSVVFQFSMSMVLMNLLIGIICNSVSKARRAARAKREKRPLSSRARRARPACASRGAAPGRPTLLHQPYSTLALPLHPHPISPSPIYETDTAVHRARGAQGAAVPRPGGRAAPRRLRCSRLCIFEAAAPWPPAARRARWRRRHPHPNLRPTAHTHTPKVIDELESTLPRWVERMMPQKYFPAFVHVLRVDPKSLDSIGFAELWRRAAGGGAPDDERGGGGHAGGACAAGGGEAGGGGALGAVMAELRALRSEVATLNDLLHTAVPSLPPSPDRSPERAGREA
ncbi:MAG: hypothetical protein J3K34DRAFT_523650 [Monoraphidium minutum]|nr:MAG: hypothetical protein J3K34DRAFT_523650 [Monoraphidium minutum]